MFLTFFFSNLSLLLFGIGLWGLIVVRNDLLVLLMAFFKFIIIFITKFFKFIIIFITKFFEFFKLDFKYCLGMTGVVVANNANDGSTYLFILLLVGGGSIVSFLAFKVLYPYFIINSPN